MSRVYVSGVGVVSPLGLGFDTFWNALVEGRSAAAEVENFDVTGMERTRACEVKGFRARDFMTSAEARRSGRCSQLTLAAARMAFEQSGIGMDLIRGPRTSVVVGTTMGEANLLGELEHSWIHDGEASLEARKLALYGTALLPIHVARSFGAEGLVHALPAACAAGNYAFSFASDLIRSGRADVVITGAAEVIERLQYAGFVRLGAMAPDRVQPFDLNRRGLLLGEGAGILVLESEAHLVRRGGVPLAEVGGAGIAFDAHHITRPHPEGTGSFVAVRDAILRSGLRPDQVDHVNAHGTATAANDMVESKVLNELFGTHRPLVTSVKSMIGHCMGAASAIEAVACIGTLLHQTVPPTIHYETPDPECDLRIVANVAQKARVDVVVNNSLAFGGYDAAVTFARPSVLPDIVGFGPVGAAA
jgi:3-oxoacyl-[acyl-carrier-protein] synthase II